MDKAEEYGFYILFLPVWGQLVVGHDWSGNSYEKLVTEDNAYQYGKWIGNRYQGRKNILWCLGGDRQPIHLGVDYKPVWRLLAEGIAKGVTGKCLKYNKPDPLWKELLMTYHSCYEMETGQCSTMSYWTDEEAWISFIMLQSGHGTTPKNYELVAKEYNRERVMPVWDGEPAYEQMPTSWPEITDFHGSWMVRKRAYWSLFAGAFGYTYGHCSVWCTISERERNPVSTLTWHEALDSEGSVQMKYLRDFMESIQIMTYRPAQELLLPGNEAAALDNHVQACVSPDESCICIYLPSGGETVILCKALNWSDAKVWWFNPRNGKFYDNNGQETDTDMLLEIKDDKLSLQAPDAGKENDWVCIASKDSKGIPVKDFSYYEMEKKREIKKVFEW